MKIKYSIILPVYNEEQIIASVLQELQQKIKLKNYEIIVVNDGSTDRTQKILEGFKFIKLINHPYNIGNGATIKTGIRASSGEIIILMDGDGQHNPEYISELLKYTNEYDMVIGARDFKSSFTLHRNFANRIYNWFATYLSGRKILDLTSGFRAVKANLVKRFLYLLPNSFSYPCTLTLSMLKAGYSIKFVPIKVRKRTGKSKIRLLKDGFNFFVIITKITMIFSPLKVFLPASILVLVLGIFHIIYRLFILNVALTITTTFLLTISLLIFLLGLISEQITQLKYEKTE